jgi:hypothetical protein
MTTKNSEFRAAAQELSVLQKNSARNRHGSDQLDEHTINCAFDVFNTYLLALSAASLVSVEAIPH